MVSRFSLTVIGFILVLGVMVSPARAELTAPTLVSPQSGEILELTTSPYQLTLSWSRVADATGYLLVLNGPAEYGENIQVKVTQGTSSPISTTLSNFVTGTYTWTVSALLGTNSATSSEAYFTVQTGSSTGGDLPAPALLLLPDYQVLRSDSAQIRFQWTRVSGAAGYLFSTSTGDVKITQPSSGKTVVAERNFTSAQAGTYIWSVTPYDSSGVQGAGSQVRNFILTPIDGSDWDFDRSGGPSPEDLYAFTLAWQEGFTTGDLNYDGLTNADDLTILFGAEKNGTYPTPTPIPGFSAPTQVSPSVGTTVGTTNVQFTWQPLVGAVGYEFNLLDDNPNSNILRIIEQPSSGNVTTTIGYLQPRARRWRVRAYFGTGAVGPFSDEIAFTVSSGR